MDSYKKTLYSKKFSNDINFVAMQSRRVPWDDSDAAYILSTSDYMIQTSLGIKDAS
jgi:hypothetical protein